MRLVSIDTKFGVFTVYEWSPGNKAKRLKRNVIEYQDWCDMCEGKVEPLTIQDIRHFADNA